MGKKENLAIEHIHQLRQELTALEARREEIQKTIARLETLEQTNLQTAPIESSGINFPACDQQAGKSHSSFLPIRLPRSPEPIYGSELG